MVAVGEPRGTDYGDSMKIWPKALAARQQLESLLTRLERADGHDEALDQMIAQALAGLRDETPTPDYTASVERCLDLLHKLLPQWRWHVGYSANGVMPYVVLMNGVQRVEAEAPTVPLALLRAIAKATLVPATS